MLSQAYVTWWICQPGARRVVSSVTSDLELLPSLPCSAGIFREPHGAGSGRHVTAPGTRKINASDCLGHPHAFGSDLHARPRAACIGAMEESAACATGPEFAIVR